VFEINHRYKELSVKKNIALAAVLLAALAATGCSSSGKKRTAAAPV